MSKRDKMPPQKYHGLYNQGATCYLNSVLQVLFMTEDFRETVERLADGNSDGIDDQLNNLFKDLQNETAITKEITSKLGITRAYEQKDAAEFLENILRLTNPEASEIFHGKLTHTTRCSGCHKETWEVGPFWNLTLNLVDSYSENYSVVDGIEEYFRASHFCGANQMYCESCDAKSDATVRCEVTRHPEVLMLLLKRFDFNYNYMMYVKNHCYVNVPQELHIPKTNDQKYELYAIVDHSGDLRGGHYSTRINDGDEWHCFDDSRVTPTKLFEQKTSELSRSAYLLFYRKVGEDNRDQSPHGPFQPSTINTHDQNEDQDVRAENATEESIDHVVDFSIDEFKPGKSRSTGEGPLSDHSDTEKDQGSGVNTVQDLLNNQECKECEVNREQRKDGKIVRGDTDLGGNANIKTGEQLETRHDSGGSDGLASVSQNKDGVFDATEKIEEDTSLSKQIHVKVGKHSRTRSAETEGGKQMTRDNKRAQSWERSGGSQKLEARSVDDRDNSGFNPNSRYIDTVHTSYKSPTFSSPVGTQGIATLNTDQGYRKQVDLDFQSFANRETRTVPRETQHRKRSEKQESGRSEAHSHHLQDQSLDRTDECTLNLMPEQGTEKGVHQRKKKRFSLKLFQNTKKPKKEKDKKKKERKMKMKFRLGCFFPMQREEDTD